jgi:hypothetical protein
VRSHAPRPRPEPEHIDREALCKVDVTLNGLRARIVRPTSRYAYVRQVDTGLGCDFSWDAAARVIARGGDFRT